MSGFVLGLCLLLEAGLAQGQAPLAGFDAYVTRALQQSAVPGVAIAIVKDDSVVLLRGYGSRQLGRPEPVTARTLFEIGSTTKAFSSAILATLVDQGKLAWDDPVTKHLPWFALKDPWVTREVTLRDLLSHRVGVTGLHNGLLTAGREDVIRRTRSLEPNVSFRARYDYSNMMYATAGLVAEAVTGRSWETLLRERVLNPLGMRSTTTDLARFWDSTQFTHCFYCPLPARPVGLGDVRGGQEVAMPHMMVGDSVVVIPWQSYDNAVSAGSIVSNVEDLSQWVRLQLGGGTYRGRRLIGETAFAEMHRPQSIITPAGPIATLARLSPSTHFWAYGLGWRMNDYRGRKVVWHTGGIVGFLAYVGLVPEERLGMVILSNGDLGYEMLPQALAYAILDRYAGKADRAASPASSAPFTDWSAELAAAMRRDRETAAETERRLVASRVKGTRPPLPLADYAGSYANPIYGEARLDLAGDRLTFQLRDGAAGTLEHWHYDLFRLSLDATWRAGWFVTFGIGPAGKVELINVQGLGEFTAVSGTVSASRLANVKPRSRSQAQRPSSPASAGPAPRRSGSSRCPNG